MRHGGPGGLLAQLAGNACEDGWRDLLGPFQQLAPPDVSLHLAVLVEPYLTFILDGQKTVESRFSLRPTVPWGRVDRGDVVLLKESGGPIVGAFTAAAVWSYQLHPNSWRDLRRDFTDALCAEPGFWEERSKAGFATLMRVAAVRRMPPIEVPKRDRRGWVVLAERGRDGRLF